MQTVGLVDPDMAAQLLEARDPGLFAARLLDLAHSALGVEELFAYRVSDEGGAPQVLASTSGLGDSAERAGAYARRFHRSDPLVEARRAARPGTGFACRIRAQAIGLAEYRKLCFERPRFVEKICFGWRRPEDSLVVSFYQRHGDAEPDMAHLAALAQLAVTGLTRLEGKSAPVLHEVRHRLAQAYPVLSAREREICARTLAGATARQIGQDLALSVGTVLTYRQRAYQKLGFSKANDLLGAIVG